MPSPATLVVYDTANAQRLQGTGAQRTTALTVNRYYAIFVGEEAVHFAQGDDSVTASITTSPRLPAGSQLTILADNGRDHISCIHEDGSTAIDLHVVPASPAP
jgi:hypothetical protein